MKPIKLEESKYTPGINFDPGKNIFSMWGKSRPEDLAAFYFPLINWWEKFIEELKGNTTLAKKINPLIFDIKVEYFNSASSKMIYDLLSIVKELKNIHIDYTINWYYYSDDEDIYESAVELSDELEIKFNYIPVERD